MRQAIQRAVLVLLIACMAAAFTPVGQILAATVSAGYLKNIFFERLPSGKERVTFVVTKQPAREPVVEYLPNNAALVRIQDLYVPEELLRPQSDPASPNVVMVTPYQKVIDGKSWVLAQIDLKQKVPCQVLQEGMNIHVDFKAISVPSSAEPVQERTASEPSAARQTSSPETAAGSVQPVQDNAVIGSGQKVYPGPRIFLDVQDADINAVFRLLAEQGKVSIVCGDDVKGTVTLNMKDVPWNQAFETILDLKGLDQRREGNVITVITLDRKKKDESDRLAASAAMQKADDDRTAREQKENVAKGKLRQIAIEAKIVEVTTNFSRELGINWGYGVKDTWSGRDMGVLMGNSASGTVTNLPSGIGLTSSNAAVNFPSLVASAPGIGLVLGSSKFILDAKLSALENSGDGKIISSPKVTTLENEKATIWQGKKVPVVTPATSTEPASVRYEDADLRLNVTPKITPRGSPTDVDRISLDIEASNKDIDDSLTIEGNPAINSHGVTSKVVVKDGDTIVVGGIYKTAETFAKDGVPWLSDIPVLGWLFKYETKTKTTREILMFITPRIIKNEP
jgi:type IV pilus assembly protein PilQ